MEYGMCGTSLHRANSAERGRSSVWEDKRFFHRIGQEQHHEPGHGFSDRVELQMKFGLRMCSRSKAMPELYRSRDLSQADSQDRMLMRGMGITTLVDLRKPSERDQMPYSRKLRSAFDIIESDIDFHGDQRSSMTQSEDIVSSYGFPGERMRALYCNMATCESEIDDLVRSLCGISGGVVIHCVNGKDRSGVVCAYAQMRYGMDYAEVKRDYLITNLLNRHINERDLACHAVSKTPTELEVLRAMFEARVEYLDAFIAKISLS